MSCHSLRLSNSIMHLQHFGGTYTCTTVLSFAVTILLVVGHAAGHTNSEKKSQDRGTVLNHYRHLGTRYKRDLEKLYSPEINQTIYIKRAHEEDLKAMEPMSQEALKKRYVRSPIASPEPFRIPLGNLMPISRTISVGRSAAVSRTIPINRGGIINSGRSSIGGKDFPFSPSGTFSQGLARGASRGSSRGSSKDIMPDFDRLDFAQPDFDNPNEYTYIEPHAESAPNGIREEVRVVLLPNRDNPGSNYVPYQVFYFDPQDSKMKPLNGQQNGNRPLVLCELSDFEWENSRGKPLRT